MYLILYYNTTLLRNIYEIKINYTPSCIEENPLYNYRLHHKSSRRFPKKIILGRLVLDILKCAPHTLQKMPQYTDFPLSKWSGS
jgi:predicted Ser/Thr protein kinase